ncbi:hypothetical protein Metfor_1283 [Methanoregula formicica SMSP]|uniref:Uncharacterized protein n=1 Tax=Methanoregula formicica (strain DSM 22288 / NBRC 105244 / SMSP) TaxID=593750 RepID=L0HE91_METFS|nr:hypothetical protein Metfor_1283 [Methanoregula formicica SMSP]
MDCSHLPYLNIVGKKLFLRKKTSKTRGFLESAARLSDNCMTIVILSPEPAAPGAHVLLCGTHNLDDIPVLQLVVLLDAHLGLRIHRVQESLADIRVHLECEIVRSGALPH